MQPFDWTELQTIFCVAQQGSLSAAARLLEVNHSTVLRRIQNFEDKHKVTIFVRDANGYRLSRHGQALLQDHEQIQGLMLGLQRRIADYDTQLEGHITLTSTENIFEHYLKTPVFQFAQTYPRVTLDLLIGNQLINMERLEADIAVRPAESLPAHHIGFQLGTFQCFYYLRSDLLPLPTLNTISDYPNWIGFNGQLAQARIGRLLAGTMKNPPILTASNFHSVSEAAKAGLGLALMPAFIGDGIPTLSRIESEAVFSSPIFVMAPEELKLSRRISAFMELLHSQRK